MFGIGFAEVIVIFLVMIIFIRPEDLPKTLRSMGRIYGKFKLMYKEVMDTKDQIIREIDKAANLDEPPPKTTSTLPALPDPPEAVPETPATALTASGNSDGAVDSGDAKEPG